MRILDFCACVHLNYNIVLCADSIAVKMNTHFQNWVLWLHRSEHSSVLSLWLMVVMFLFLNISSYFITLGTSGYPNTQIPNMWYIFLVIVIQGISEATVALDEMSYQYFFSILEMCLDWSTGVIFLGYEKYDCSLS